MVRTISTLSGVVIIFFWKTLCNSMEMVTGDTVDREVSGVSSERGERFEFSEGCGGEKRVEELVARG